MKFIFCSFIFILPFLKVFSQFEDGRNYISPSPSSAALLRYATTPVNNYTGVAGISAPIYELNARGINVPIALTYHSSGIKVQDIASNVGLGWAISTQCIISRIVRGLPDESTTGYFGSDMGAKIYQPMTTQTMVDISTNQSDSEPDLFYYNINGVVGKFVFNKDKNPVMLNNNGIKVLNSPFKKELNVDGWILCDQNGNKFFYGLDSSSIENTQTIIYGESSNINLNYTSSWFMNKTVLFNETETINYNYDAGQEIRYKQYRSRRKFMNKLTTTFQRAIYFLGIRIRDFSVDNEVEVMNKSTWNENIEDIIASPKYLKSIVSSNESAYFSYETNNRQDLSNGWILSRIEVKNSASNTIKDFKLNYKYINTDNDKQKNIDLTNQAITRFMNIYASGFDYNNSYYNRVPLLNQLKSQIDNLSDYDYYMQYCSISGATPSLQAPNSQDLTRLFLTDVVTIGTDGISNIPLFRFVYNEQQKLPKRTSVQMDHWGYYNNNSIYDQFPVEVNENYASKLPDPINAQAGMLQKIIYSTGSYKLFNYELNDFYNNANATVEFGGGLRIKSIVDVPGYNSAPTVKTFKYKTESGTSSGRLLTTKPVYISYLDHSDNQIFAPNINFQPIGMPQYNFTQIRGDMVTPIPAGQSLLNSLISSLPNLFNGGASSSIRYTPYILESTVSFASIFDLEGNSVGYDEVVIENGDEGKTVYKYTNASDFPDYSNQSRVNSSFIATSRVAPNLSPFTPVTSYGFARGLPKQVTIYNDKNQLIKRLTYAYTFNSVADSVKGFRCAVGKINTTNGIFQSYSTNYYNIGYYYYVSKPILLTELKEEDFLASSSASLRKIKSYSYDANYPTLLTQLTTTASDGTQLFKNYKYAAHYSQIGGYNGSEYSGAAALMQNNAPGILLDEQTSNGTEVIGRRLSAFENEIIGGKNLISMKRSYQGKGNVLETFESYTHNSSGNVIQKQIVNGPASTIIWDKNNVIPILEVKNAQLGDIFFEDFENNNSVSIGNGFSGNRYYVGDFTSSFNPAGGKPYKFSYWYLSNGIWMNSGWIDYPGAGTILSLGDAVDDVLIIPSLSQSKYMNYGPYGLKSVTNGDSKTEFYEYDSFNRLSVLRDYNRDIIRHFKFNDVSQYVGDIYLNDEIVVNVVKNDCPTGNATAVNYRVPAGKHFSYQSKYDANSKAQNDANENAQNFANANGSCQQTAYYSLYYSTDPYLQYVNYTVYKSQQDNLNATITLRIRYDDRYTGQPAETYVLIQLDAYSTQASDSFEVRAGSYCEVEIVGVGIN